MNGIGAKVVGIDSKKKLRSHEMTYYFYLFIIFYLSVCVYFLPSTHQRFRTVRTTTRPSKSIINGALCSLSQRKRFHGFEEMMRIASFGAQFIFEKEIISYVVRFEPFELDMDIVWHKNKRGSNFSGISK